MTPPKKFERGWTRNMCFSEIFPGSSTNLVVLLPLETVEFGVRGPFSMTGNPVGLIYAPCTDCH